MATNAYTGTTVFGTFQTLNYGDRIWPDVELSNWQKVENRFLSMNLDNFVINHGTFAYVLNPEDPTDVQVTLSPNGIDSAFTGSINGCYFKINTVMTWNMSITGDGTYYLYLKEITGQTDPTSDSSLEKEYTQTEYTGSDLKTRILMAIVTQTGGVLQPINHDPPSQMTSQHFYDHMFDTVDPHGSTLYQTELLVTGMTAQNAHVSSLTATNGYVSSLTAGSAFFTNFSIGTASFSNISATSCSVGSITGSTGNFEYISGTTASFSYATASTAYIGTLNSGTANISSISATSGNFSNLFIGGATAYREYVFEQGFATNSTGEFNIYTQVGVTAQPVFLSASMLTPCQTGLYFKYSGLSDEITRYVVYNQNSIGVTGRIFIKYEII